MAVLRDLPPGRCSVGYTDILYEKGNGVAQITINRPEVYSAIRGKTTDEMVDALEDAKRTMAS